MTGDTTRSAPACWCSVVKLDAITLAVSHPPVHGAVGFVTLPLLMELCSCQPYSTEPAQKDVSSYRPTKSGGWHTFLPCFDQFEVTVRSFWCISEKPSIYKTGEAMLVFFGTQWHSSLSLDFHSNIFNFLILSPCIYSRGEKLSDLQDIPLVSIGLLLELEKIIKCKETKTKIIHTLIFLITMYGCESWAVKKADGFLCFLFWHVVLEESFVDTLDCPKDEQVGPRANQAWNISGGKNETETILF